MKINTHTAIKNIKGADLKDGDTEKFFTVGTALSEILVASKMGGKMKCFVLAQKFYNDKEVELDEADKELVKSTVEATELYNNLVNGQLLILLTETPKEVK